MMNQIPQIKTVIPMTNSIFTRMNYDFVDIDPSQLDILFFTDYGNRNVSPLVQNVVKDVNNITEDELTRLSLLVLSFYQKKWDRYKDIYTIEYDKIHNYYDELIESQSDSNNEQITGTNKSVLTGTDKDVTTSTLTNNLTKSSEVSTEISDKDKIISTNTRTDNLTKESNSTSSKTDTGNETGTVFGFNSNVAVNAQGNNSTLGSTSDDTTSVTDTGTQKNDLDTTITKNSTTDVTNSSLITTSKTKERSYIHKGNIGNLTTQEILRQEIKLWEWNYINSILSDTKDMLTLPMYLG